MAGKWSELLDEPKIPLSQYTCMFSLKAVLLTLFGNIMKAEKEVLDFKKAYDVVRTLNNLAMSRERRAYR